MIKKSFGKNLKEWKVREIVIEMGFTNQQPIFKSYQQSQEAVEKLEKKTLPHIKEEAKKEGRNIYYCDEAGFKSSNHKGKTRGKKGKTPVVTSTGARFGVKLNIIGKSKVRNEIYEI